MRVVCVPSLLCTEQFAPAFKFIGIIAVTAVVAGRELGPREILSENPSVVLKPARISAVVLITANDVTRLTAAFPAIFAPGLLSKKLSRQLLACLTAALFRLLTKSPLRLPTWLLLKALFTARLTESRSGLLPKSPLLFRILLLLLHRWLRTGLALLLTETPFRLRIRLLLLNRGLTSRLALLLAETAFRLRVRLLLLNRRLTSRLTLLLP